jgi:predicted ArsR family transcriptional regulator
MRDVGREFASEQPPLQGDLRQKLATVSALLAELGAPNDIEEDGDAYLVRGHGCVLSTIVHEHAEACRSMESFLKELLDVPVNACCDRTDRPRCCFRVSGSED